MTKNLLILFQLVVGLGWVVGLVLAFLAISAIAEPNSAVAIITHWGALLFGPILLFGGSILLANSTRQWPRASVVAFLGSLAVSVQSLVWVAPSLVESLRRHDNRWAAFWACIVGVSVTSSVVAYRLHRFARSSSRMPSVA